MMISHASIETPTDRRYGEECTAQLDRGPATSILPESPQSRKLEVSTLKLQPLSQGAHASTFIGHYTV